MEKTGAGIASHDLAEIKQDLIQFNAQIGRIKNANQFGKLGLAEAALSQAAGLLVSLFEFMRNQEMQINNLGKTILHMEKEIAKNEKVK